MDDEIKVKAKPIAFKVSIPLTAEPRTTGDYFVNRAKEKFDVKDNAVLTATFPSLAATINNIAIQGEKEKRRLEQVSLRFGGVSWLPAELSFKWEGESEVKNVKRIVAREGLVVLGFIAVSSLVVGFSNTSSIISTLGGCIFLCGYPTYLLIRFILWAVKTLKEK